MTRCSEPDCLRSPRPGWAVCDNHADLLLAPRLGRTHVERLSVEFVPVWRRRALRPRDMSNVR